MALLAIEGFEGAGTTEGAGGAANVLDYIRSRYDDEFQLSGNGRPRLVAGHGFGEALSWGGDTNADLNRFDIPLGAVLTEVFVGMWFKPRKTIEDDIVHHIGFRTTAGVEDHVRFETIDNQHMIFSNNDGQVKIADTFVTNVFTPDAWTFIEMRIVINNTTGIVQVRRNGVEILNATNQDTLGDSNVDNIDTLRFYGNEAGSNTDVSEQWVIDDIYALDTTGSLNTTFLGPVKVEALFPNTEGATINFTPSAGTNNALNVDDNPKDDDTTYNSSADTASNKDLFDTPSLSNITGNIRGVLVTNQARVDNPGPIGLQSIVAEGTPTQGTGAIVEIADTTTFTRVWHLFESNPDTSALWALAEVNDMEIGYEID
jgi:hypothetical protein